MNTSRKDMILKTIDDYTIESISNDSFTFENCNAQTIALDTNLDRANVSRILNQLFNEQALIKVKGRPTLYLSRKVVITQFHFKNVPQVISNPKTIKDYFVFHTNADDAILKKGLTMIGSRKGESLHEIINHISPALYYNQTSTMPAPIIAIQGEVGSGKKYFSQQLFEYGIHNKYFSKKSKYQIIDHATLLNKSYELESIINPNITSVIMIEVFHSFYENDIYQITNNILHLYSFHNKSKPSLIFLIDSKVQNFEYFKTLTPYYISYPNMSDRTPEEILSFVLHFIQDTCDNIGYILRVSKDTLLPFACKHYPLNLYQLKNEVTYTVTKKVYTSGINSNYPVNINFDTISKEVLFENNYDKSKELDFNNLIQQLLPPVIEFIPNQKCKAIDNLMRSDIITDLFITVENETLAQRAQYDVYNVRSKLTDSSSLYEHYTLIETLEPTFNKTKLKNDKQLLSFLYYQIDKMLTGTFSQEFTFENIEYIESEQSKKLSTRIITLVEHRMSRQLSTTYRNYIRNYIYYFLESISVKSSVVLVLCHGERIAENFAQIQNYATESRLFYSFDYTNYYQNNDINLFINELSKILAYIDRGHGVLLVGDIPPLLNLNQKLIKKTNIPIFSIAAASLPLFVRISDTLKIHGSQFGSMMYTVMNDNKYIKSFLESTTLINKGTRQEDPYIKAFDHYFKHVNTLRTNEILYGALFNICKELSIPMNNDIIIHFLFHGNFMLERTITQELVNFKGLFDFIYDNEEIYTVIRKNIKEIISFSRLEIDEAEIAVLTEIINNFIKKMKIGV